MLPAEKDFVTTAPAATTVLSAIVTPGKMVTAELINLMKRKY